jgi:two-component system chemotaxis response regulator CheB
MSAPAPAGAAVIVIGASAGGVEALLPLLPRMGPHSPPVAIVVHLPRDRPSLLAGVFGSRCAVPVREAVDKSPLQPGSITFAPPDYHLLLERDATVSLSIDEPVKYSRPSIDVLFESAASAFGPRALGVLLTGASEDGAAGAAALRRRGARVVVQDPREASADIMPRAALAAVPDAYVASLGAIGALLERLVFEEAK